MIPGRRIYEDLLMNLKNLFARHRKLVVVIAAIGLLWLNRHSGVTPQELIVYVDGTIQLLTLAGVYQAANTP